MHVNYLSVFVCVLCLCSVVQSQRDEERYKSWELSFMANGGCRDRGTGCGLSGGDPYSSHSNRFPYGRNVHGTADAPSLWSLDDLWSPAQNVLQTTPRVSTPGAVVQGSPGSPSHHPRPRFPQGISRARAVSFPHYAPNAGQPPLSTSKDHPRTDNSWPPFRSQPARPYIPPQQQNQNDQTFNRNLHHSAQTLRKSPSVQTDTTYGRKVADSYSPYETSLWNSQNLDKKDVWKQIPQRRNEQVGKSKETHFDPGFGFDSGQYVSGGLLAEKVPVSDAWFSGRSADDRGRGQQSRQDLFGPWESKPSPLDRVGFEDGVHRQRYNTMPPSHPRPTGKSSVQEPNQTPLDLHSMWASPYSDLGQTLKKDGTQVSPDQSIRHTSSHPPYSSAFPRGHFSSAQRTRPAFVDTLLQNIGVLQGGHERQKDKARGDQNENRLSKDIMEGNSRQLLSGKRLRGKIVATSEYGDNVRNVINDREKGIQNKRDVNNKLTAVSDTDTPSESSIHDHLQFPVKISRRKKYQQGDLTNPTVQKINLSKTHQTRLKENPQKPQNSLKSALQNQQLRNPSVTKRLLPFSEKDANKAGSMYASSWRKFLKTDSKGTQTKEPSVLVAESPTGSYEPEVKNEYQRNNKVKGDNRRNKKVNGDNQRNNKVKGASQRDNKVPSWSLQHHQEAPSSLADNLVDVRANQQTHRTVDNTQDSEEDRPKARKKNIRRISPSSADHQQPLHSPEQFGDHHSDDVSKAVGSGAQTKGQSGQKPDRSENFSGTEVNPCTELKPTPMCSLAYPQCSGYVCDAQRFCLSVEANLTTITYPEDQQYFQAAFRCVMSGLWGRRGGSTCGEVEGALQQLLMDRDPAHNCLLQQQGLRLCDMLSEPRNQFFVLNLLVPFHASSSFRNDLARTVHKATEYCPQVEDMRVFRTLLMRSPHLQRYLHLLRR